MIFNWLYKKYFQIFHNVKFGKGVRLSYPVKLYDCRLDDDVFVGEWTEIQDGCFIGKRSRIQSHSFLAAGTKIAYDVFWGHNTISCNDKNPICGDRVWLHQGVVVESNCSIGSGAVLCPGIELKTGCRIGAGAVVTKNVPSGELWLGNPARKKDEKSEKIGFKS